MSDFQREIEGNNGARYERVELLSSGGMAQVFRARGEGVEGFKKTLAIKKIRPEMARKPNFREMFVAEARLCALLDHPNIVSVIDFGASQDDFFIVMELIEGQPITNVQDQFKARKLPIDMVAYIITSVCTALHYAHNLKDENGEALGVVHRDITPRNIMVSNQGEIKLIDFGISRAVQWIGEQGEKRLKGHHRYMSPEQASMEELDHRSDIFQVGILLYELLTGKRFYSGKSGKECLKQAQQAIIPAKDELLFEIPGDLGCLCLKAIAPKPKDRFKTAEDMAEALRPFHKGSFQMNNMCIWMKTAFNDKNNAEGSLNEATNVLSGGDIYSIGSRDEANLDETLADSPESKVASGTGEQQTKTVDHEATRIEDGWKADAETYVFPPGESRTNPSLDPDVACIAPGAPQEPMQRTHRNKKLRRLSGFLIIVLLFIAGLRLWPLEQDAPTSSAASGSPDKNTGLSAVLQSSDLEPSTIDAAVALVPDIGSEVSEPYVLQLTSRPHSTRTKNRKRKRNSRRRSKIKGRKKPKSNAFDFTDEEYD